MRAFAIFSFIFVIILSSCEDKIDKRDMYTFTAETALDYFNNRSQFSSFAKILTISRNGKGKNTSRVSSLLNTRGHYTIFAPTNDAIKIYLDSVYGTTEYLLDTMSQEVADKIVLVSIMDLGIKELAWNEAKLHEGALEARTLDDQHLVVKYGDFGDGTYIKLNNAARILKSNIEVYNGIIFIIDRVLPPPPSSLYGLIKQTPNLRIFSMLLELTSWGDSIVAYEDKTYNDSIYFKILAGENIAGESWKHYATIVRYRLYNYTAFTEPDDVFIKEWNLPEIKIDSTTKSITNKREMIAAIAAKCREAYPDATDADYTSRNNAVNQFVSYHLFEGKFPYERLAAMRNEFGAKWYYAPAGTGDDLYQSINTWDYFQTMGKPNRLLKVTQVAKTKQKFLNRHSYYNDTYFGDYQETSCDHEGIEISPNNGPYDNSCLNGHYFPIRHLLIYDDYVKHVVLNERIRYSFVYSQPEIMNILKMKDIPLYYQYGAIYNNGKIIDDRRLETEYYYYPGYCKNFKIKDKGCYNTTSSYAYKRIPLLCRSKDITFKILSVPYAGNWEIRLSHMRGLIEYYIGNSMNGKMEHIGPPHNLLRSNILHLLPQEISNNNTTNDINKFRNGDSTVYIENDHNARKKELMYPPFSIVHRTWGHNIGYDVAREIRTQARIIIYRGYMTPEKDYFIRLQNLDESNNDYNPFYKDYTNGNDFEAWYVLHLIELVPECVYENHYRKEDWW